MGDRAHPDSARPEDVKRAARSVFGDTVLPVPVDSADASIGPTWDMNVRSYETQARVVHYVQLFSGEARDRFQQRVARGTQYDPMIRAKLRAGGLPEDLTYLALIESGYDPHAYSRSAAVGIWQFMSSTARDLGLRVDWWMDERRDPARATDGAIRFLSFLQKQFGSLYLAAAAYNGGPGRVSRGLTRFADEMDGTAGEDKFFALAEHDYLRGETRNYVPQLIAAALVAKEPVRYGLTFDTLPPFEYDSVRVEGGVPLAAIAMASGSTMSIIRDLNPALLRGMTPPGGQIWLHVPRSATVSPDSIARALAALPDSARVGLHLVHTKGTETVATVATRAGLSPRQLASFNPAMRTTRKGRLLEGQSLRVPTALVLAAARDVPDPSIERYGVSDGGSKANGGAYVVKRGETLGTISRRYHLSVARLKALNGLRTERVIAGQVLRVRAGSAAPTATTRTATAKRSARSAPAAGKGTATSSAHATAPKTSTKPRSVKHAATKGGASTPATKKATPSK